MIESVKQYVKVKRLPFLPDEKIENYDRDQIVIAIQRLHKAAPLNTLISMRVARRPLPDAILSEVLGRPSSRKFLHHAGTYFFGSWNKALIASGIDPIRSAYNKFWTQELINKAIRALDKAGHPLTVLSMWRDRSRKTSNTLKQVTGKATTGSALHDAARRNFGSWDRALEQSGLCVEAIKEKPFWTKKKIVASIQILHKNGVALNSQNMGLEHRRAVSSMIQRGIGKKRTGRSLHSGAYRIFGSWDRALCEARISPRLHRKRQFGWNIRQISRILNGLYYMKVPVNAASLYRDYSEQTKKIIYDFTGQHSHGNFLFKYGNAKLGSWDAMLKESGFMLSEVRRSGSPCMKDQEKVIQMIRMFHKNDIALNRSAMIKHSHHLKYFVEHNFGPAVSGYSILGTAIELFGSWDQALWEAGLDSSAIRMRSRPHISNMPVAPHQIEDIKREGVAGLVTYLGAPSKSPEEIMEAEENANRLQGAVEMFDDQERELVDRILDAILQIHHYKDQDQLIHFVVEHLDNEVSEFTVKSIFGQLAQSLRRTTN